MLSDVDPLCIVLEYDRPSNTWSATTGTEDWSGFGETCYEALTAFLRIYADNRLKAREEVSDAG